MVKESGCVAIIGSATISIVIGSDIIESHPPIGNVSSHS